MSDDRTADLSYEEALDLLDLRLRELEEGDLTLEGALAAAEEASRYLRVCQARLDEAKRKIEVRAVPPPAPEPEPDRLQGEPLDPPPAEEGRLL